MAKKKDGSLAAFTDAEVFAECARRNRAKQTHLPNPPVLRPCPYCKKKFSARALRAHKPRCPRKPK
jgi:hypothetical protein